MQVESLRSLREETVTVEAFQLPDCLRSRGRVAILSFHSGEDRRVKKAFQSGLSAGVWCAISEAVLRASAEERRDNPRSASAKLRWAVRS